MKRALEKTEFYTKEQVMDFIAELARTDLQYVIKNKSIKLPEGIDIYIHPAAECISVAYYKRHIGYIDMFSFYITYVM